MIEIFGILLSAVAIYFSYYKKFSKKPVRIAFGCEDRVGKDTACDYLCAKYSGKTLSFASPLYKSLYSTQSIFKMDKQKDREYLMMLGKWARSKNPLIFVNLLLEKAKEFEDQNIYISDLRYENEYDEVLKNKFVTVRIIRSTKDESKSELLNKHWDYTIINDGTLEEFYKNLDNMYKFVEDNL